MSITLKYKDLLSKNFETCFSFRGQLTYATVTEILEQIKGNLIKNLAERNKLYSIIVELFENSFNHQQNIEDEVELVILKNDNSYRVLTFNTISDLSKNKLLEKSDEVNNQPLTELKSEYKKKMIENLEKEKGSAGLGLEIIRLKSKNEILISTDELPNGNVVVVDVKIDL